MSTNLHVMGNRIRTARQFRKLTAEQLSEQLGIAPGVSAPYRKWYQTTQLRSVRQHFGYTRCVPGLPRR